MSPSGLGTPPAAVPPHALPPYSPSAIFSLNNNSTNMSGSSLTDALILLSGAYLSVVQPAPGPPKVGIFTVLPTGKDKLLSDTVTRLFKPSSQRRTFSKYRNIQDAFDPTSSFSESSYSPQVLLNVLCHDVFGNNTITVFYVNNHIGMTDYGDSAGDYFPQILSSLGVPIISYDTQFSVNKQTPMTMQLAPTMGQMMDVFFAFLKKYDWTHFSFLCMLSTGCSEEIAAIRIKVEESQRRGATNLYGEKLISFNLLSYVNFTNGMDTVEVEEKLRYEMDRDTRIIFVQGKKHEVITMLEVAKGLGLTTKEYVWIFTMPSVNINPSTEGVVRAIPLGSFIIGYDARKEHMPDLINKAMDIWLQALDSLAGSPEMEDIDFETGLSCNDEEIRRRRSLARKNRASADGGRGSDDAASHRTDTNLKWKYGEILYQYLLKTKFGGKIEFDRYGILKSNRFWISNVQLFDAKTKSTGTRPSLTGRVGSTSQGRTATRNRFSNNNRQSGTSLNRNRSHGNTRRKDQTPRTSSGINRFSGSSRGKSRIPSRPSQSLGSRSLRNSAAKSFLGRQNDKMSSYRSDEERRESDIIQTTAEPLEGEDHFVVGDSKPSKNRFRLTSSTDESIVPYYDNSVVGHRDRRPETSPSGGSQLFGWSKQAMNKNHDDYRRSKRFIRGPQKIAKQIATWDGYKLTVSAITWPGGASTPPKGKPEKYVLRVATWHEDPHVIFVDPDNTTGECDSHSLRCTVYVRDPMKHIAGNETKERCCTGLAMDLLKRLSEELHIDVDLQEVKDGAYGSPIDANQTSWTGLMGMLIRNEADLAMAAMAITPERSEAVDFSTPFLQTGITIIVAIRAGVISPTAFLEPYDYLSWTLILVFSVHATGTSIFIFEWLSPYGLDHGKTPLSVHKFSLFRSFWLIWAMLFGASVSTDMPRGCASRFLANIWALFAVVFCASYTANLAAFMITKDDFYDLSGIQDWRLRHPHHRQPPFKFATITNSSTDTNIRKNFPQIHSFMSSYGQNDVKDAIDALKKGNIQAFIYDSTTLEYEVGKDVGCRLKTVGKRIAETGYGVAFPKKSQWKKKFDVALLRLQEDGEIERIQKFWLAGACHKKKEGVGVSSHTLGILNFTSAFILLGGGIILGVLLLTLEHMYFRFGRKQLKKWDKYGCCSLISLSMGQSLTFERSVMEAIDFHRHHKCKDPICETQLWKVKHELDLALLKIAQLRKQIAYTSSGQPKEDDDESSSPKAICGGEDTPSEKYHNGSTAPRRRRQSKADEDKQSGETTKALLLSDGADSDNNGDDIVKYVNKDNNYSVLPDTVGPRTNYNKPKPKPKPPPRNSSQAEPDMRPAVKPRPPAKRPHERSIQHHNAPSRDNAEMQRQQRQPQPSHRPNGNKVHPRTDDSLNFDSLQQQSFPDPRSNNGINNTRSSTSPVEPPLPYPPPSIEPVPLKLNSPSADGTAPSSYSSYESPPSPPLPPPPTPPPIIDNIQDPCSNDSPISSPASSRPASCSNPYERAGAITPAPFSDSTMYEPVALDPITSYPSSSPSSPTSSSSQTSHNPPLSTGGVSELSNEGMSSPSSPDRLSYSSDTLTNLNTNSTRHPQQPVSGGDDFGRPSTSIPTSTPLQGNVNTTNPFSQQSPHYSNTDSPSSLDNQNSNSSSEPNSVVERKERNKEKNGDVTSMTSLKEADNDVNSRRGRSDDGNVYVNVDDIGGKETTF